jgi:hypothetical protein
MSEEPTFDLSNLDLSTGIDGLIRGIQYQNPEMNIAEIETLGNSLLEKVGEALRNGDQIASVTLKPDGNFDLKIWHINPKEDD